MDTKQINDALERIFKEEDQRIVFWNDPEREFQNILPFLNLETVNVVRLDEMGALEVKIKLERDDPTGRYLLYSPTDEPNYEDDWLLDIRLYSRSFRADKASVILDELGLQNLHLRQHLADRRKFFDNKDRLQKLKTLVASDDTEIDLDRKMLAVVLKADPPELFTIFRTLFHYFTEGKEDIDLDNPPAVWEQIDKFNLAPSFWEMVKTTFGYSEDDPSLKNLLIRLFVTEYSQKLKADLPTALCNLVLPPVGRANAVVFLDQWRDSTSKGSSYDLLANEVAALIHLESHLQGLEINQLIDVMTFFDVEKAIASGLQNRVMSTAETIDAEEVRAVALRRKDGHWASPNVNGDTNIPRTTLYAIYDALVAAADFYALRNRYPEGFHFDSAEATYHAYEEELFRFDQLYRYFNEGADQPERLGWNILKPLRDKLEACYTNWYLPQLSLAWGRYLEPASENSLLAKWRLEKVHNQHDFYDRNVQSRLDEAENRKAFVVVSDALRYEIAQELVSELNGKYRFEASLTSQLGVLPSYTSLGMASLLPHKTLAYKPNGDIVVDGKPTSSTEQRDAILESVGGMACKSDVLMSLKKEEGREFVGGKRVVYVYHNKIDAIGDDGKTEESTFQAIRSAIDELASLIMYIVNNLNGNHIVITADHGFLFTKTAPGEPEKSKLEDKPEGTIKAKKRYLLGRNLPHDEAALHGTTAVTAGAEGEMEFWIPRGMNRFHFAGGARFFHGGAMLQEIVVPVITVKHRKDKAARGETKVKAVTVHVLGSNHKITTNRHRFALIQTEAVSERVKPITLKVAIYDGEEAVTNIETVTFDCATDKMEDRQKWVPLVLLDRQYDKKTPYRLVLRDAETGVEQQSETVIIDRAFTDDF